MTPITFQQFKDELTELYNSSKSQYHDFCRPRFYEELPYNIAPKIYKKDFRRRWWFIFDFNEIYTGIITYEPEYDNFNIYIECRGLKREGEPQLGKTMKMAMACTATSAWTTLSLYVLQVYMGVYLLTRNDVYYMEDTNNRNFLDGDCPFDMPYQQMSFSRGLDLLIEAKKHPDREWKGQRIGLTLSGQFALCEYIVEI